jgi:TetR/AcrR family transcriptional regulator
MTNRLVKNMAEASTTRTQTDRADQSRARILDAAIQEFSENGLAGARTEQIAEAAGVNKALIYYYFQGKEALYVAALESVAQRIVVTSLRALVLDCSAGERFLYFALHHFDRIYSESVFQKLMQQEMIRLTKGEPNVISPLVETLFKPLAEKTNAVVEEGMRLGELVSVDSTQVMFAALGANVFYFLSAPMMRMISDRDPFTRTSLELRRKAAIEYLGQSIFLDREHGASVAARVLAASPMPLIIKPPMTLIGKPVNPEIKSAPTKADELRSK